MKICKLCNQEKSLEDFHKDLSLKDGRKNICKDCYKSKYECICNTCGKSFKTYSKSIKYCSDICRGGNIPTKCLNCNTEFSTNKYKLENGSGKFCSKDCYWKYNRGENNPLYNKKEVTCGFCGEKFKVQNKRLKKTKIFYCSKDCKNKHHSILMSGESNSNYKGKKRCSCTNCGKDIYLIPSIYSCTDIHFCSKDCKYSYNRIRYKGENNPNYNPELSKLDRVRSRHIPGYKDWVLLVYTRDNFSCKCCGDSTSGNLIAHHLDGYNWDKENRLNVSNGVTLCTKCHREFHNSYGYGNNTKSQFIEFMKDMLIRMEG